MMFSFTLRSYLRRHMLSLILFSTSLLAAGFSSVAYFNAEHEYNYALLTLQQAKSKNRFAQSQKETFDQYYPQFELLKMRGFIGDSKRLQWLETLQLVSTKFEFPYLDFTIEKAESALEGEDEYFHSRLNLVKTPMDLKYHLMHEGDWFHLLSYLHDQAQGVFSVNLCVLNKDSRTIGTTGFRPLVGNCELQWYSIKDVTLEAEQQ